MREAVHNGVGWSRGEVRCGWGRAEVWPGQG